MPYAFYVKKNFFQSHWVKIACKRFVQMVVNKNLSQDTCFIATASCPEVVHTKFIMYRICTKKIYYVRKLSTHFFMYRVVFVLIILLILSYIQLVFLFSSFFFFCFGNVIFFSLLG
jgi:hypothetical protein